MSDEYSPMHPLLSEEISLDKLLTDIDAQLEILTAIAQDNAILNEHLRLFHEARETLIQQQLEMQRLLDLIDPDDLLDHASQLDRYSSQEDL